MLQIGVETGFRMASFFIVAKLFGPVLVGALGVILTTGVFFQRIIEALATSVIKNVAEEESRDRPAAVALGWWGGLGFLPAALVLVPLMIGFFFITMKEFAADHSAAILFGALFFIFTSGRLGFEAAMKGMKDFGAQAKIVVALSPIQAVAIVVAAYMRFGVAAYLLISAVFAAMNVALLAYFFLTRHIKTLNSPLARPDKSGLRQTLGYARPLMLRSIISFFYFRVNLLLIENLGDSYEAGQYAFAERFVLIPLLAVAALVSTANPRFAVLFARGDRAEISRLSGRVYGSLVLMLLPIVFLFIAAPIYLLPFFPEFAMASMMVQVFGLMIIANGLGAVAINALLVFGGKASLLMWLDIFGSAANLVVAYFGIKWFGAMGGVVGFTMLNIVYSLICIAVAHATQKIPFSLRFRG